jgi:hypothetical protein
MLNLMISLKIKELRSSIEEIALSTHIGYEVENVYERSGAEKSVGLVHVDMHKIGEKIGISLTIKIKNGIGTLVDEQSAYKGMTFESNDSANQANIISA